MRIEIADFSVRKQISVLFSDFDSQIEFSDANMTLIFPVLTLIFGIRITLVYRIPHAFREKPAVATYDTFVKQTPKTGLFLLIQPRSPHKHPSYGSAVVKMIQKPPLAALLSHLGEERPLILPP